MSCRPSGVRTSTCSSCTVPSTHGRRRHGGQRPALLVGDDQAVQTNDRRAVAGELVVGVAEERQPLLDAAECRRGLSHVAELDLACGEPRELQDVGQWHDDLADDRFQP